MTVHESCAKHYIIDSYDTCILLLPYMNNVIDVRFNIIINLWR